MNSRGRIMCLIVFVMTTAALAIAEEFACEPLPPSPNYKQLTIDASKMAVAKGSLQYKNGDQVWIVVTHVNPFATKYVLKLKRQPVVESAIAAFVPAIGGIAGEFLPKESPPPKVAAAVNAAPQAACLEFVRLDEDSTRLHERFDRLTEMINDASTTYGSYGQTFDKASEKVHRATQCKDIQTAGTEFRALLSQIQSPDRLESQKLQGIPNDQQPVQLLQAEISDTTAQAKWLGREIADYRRATYGNRACDSYETAVTARQYLVDKLIGPTSGAPALQNARDAVDKLNAKYRLMSSARDSVESVFNGSVAANPFAMTQAVTDTQSDIEITLTPVSTTAAAEDVSSGGAAAVPNSKPKAATESSVFDTTIHFGYGARFSISGGVVISTLLKREFTTANGVIAYQDNSKTRISPVAQLNSRIFDCDATRPNCLWWPQFSFGITAKADDKGTSPEYLIGPSWAFAGRQLLFTVGAYAGKQQRLLGGLHVGDPTTLSAANLPIAKEYHWNAGFSITWKLK